MKLIAPMVFLALSLPAFAGNLGDDIPLAHFNDRDREIFAKTLEGALDKGADGAAVSWSNPDTQARGEIKPTRTFDRAGSKCRTLTIANDAKGRSASAPYTFCKASGKWALANSESKGK